MTGLSEGWSVFEGARVESDGPASSTLVPSVEHHVSASLWSVGAEDRLHGNGASTAWILVVSGQLEEERYEPAADGEWHFRRCARAAGSSFELPPGALHRLVAHTVAEVLMVVSPRPARRITPFEVAHPDALRRARAEGGQVPSRDGHAPSWEP